MICCVDSVGVVGLADLDLGDVVCEASCQRQDLEVLCEYLECAGAPLV